MDQQSDAAGAQLNIDVTQTSKIGRFLWIGLYSTLLAIPTLTLFRFWARTFFRRQLWADTRLAGEALEYTGKGSELFVGFLIAIGTVVLPTVFVLAAAQFLLGGAVAVAVAIVVYLLFYVLIFVALFLARRYQMSRTLWRGVRFQQDGSAWTYGFVGFGYLLLTLITLGWFAPVMRLKLENYLWSNARYGDFPFAFDESKEARTEPVWKSFALAWFGGILLYAGLGAAAFLMGMTEPGAMTDVAMFAQFYLVALGFGLVLLFFVAWHEAVMIRQTTKMISIGGLKLSSRMKSWDIIELSLTNTLLIIFTLGIGLYAAQMRVWRRCAQRIETDGALDMAAIEQAASRGPGSGEGMADAFDLSPGI